MYTNYKDLSNNFKKLYFYPEENGGNIQEISNNIIETSYNILIYNKLNNISTLTLKNSIDLTSNNREIYFTVIKKINYTSSNYGKLYLNSDFIYLNSKALNNTNTFTIDNSYIYLSLGNGITGITQSHFNKNIRLTLDNNNNIRKINFSHYNALNNAGLDLSNNYLLDSTYNYDYTNILYNNIINSPTKFANVYLKNFYDYFDENDMGNNIYKNEINSINIRNDSTIINSSYNNIVEITKTNISEDITYLLDTTIHRDDNILKFDFRYNYNTSFYANLLLNIVHNETLINFYKINFTGFFQASLGSDFENVDCIFVYRNPETTTNPNFQYPNNNIEVIKSPNIDTLSKAIVLLEDADTSVTNSIFIPARNGSNLSRKKIQGLIGLNDVPKLLSIEPYDPTFIDGRGFQNQFLITDSCKSYSEKVENKLNSQKHISVKKPTNTNINTDRVSRKLNYANMVRNRRLNKNSSNVERCEIDPSTIKNYNTPFMNTLWKRSKP